MSRPWQNLERRETTDGVFELRQRGVDDFLILFDDRVLMNSRQSQSERQLGLQTCEGLRGASRVLVGGLGMGLTLRAVLDSLDAEARVTVAELHLVVVDWCRGPLADLSRDCLADSRVTVRIGDVAERIREAADGVTESYDAIVLDLFEGPHARTESKRDPLY
ncbi:MAG: spermidine synthase, partial [Myxococcota bacterium]